MGNLHFALSTCFMLTPFCSPYLAPSKFYLRNSLLGNVHQALCPTDHLIRGECKHQYKLPFDLQNRTFRLVAAATRETWFVVIHPIVAPATELLSSRRERLKKQAKSSRLSALKAHHAQALVSYIKEIFLSSDLIDERVEPSWNLNSPLSQKLTRNKWTLFQERFMEDWEEYVERHSYNSFWAQN